VKIARKRTATIRRRVRRAIARRRKTAMTSLVALVDEIAACLGGYAADAVGDLEVERRGKRVGDEGSASVGV
jgi:hypothetical protein